MLIADHNGESDDFVSDLPYALPLFHLSDGKVQGGRELVGLDICHLLRMLGQCLVKLPDNMETFQRVPRVVVCAHPQPITVLILTWRTGKMRSVNRSDGYPLG